MESSAPVQAITVTETTPVVQQEEPATFGRALSLIGLLVVGQIAFIAFIVFLSLALRKAKHKPSILHASPADYPQPKEEKDTPHECSQNNQD